MKKIYTSNYARHANNPDAIGISFIVPEWYYGRTMSKLAPTGSMIAEYKTTGDYRTVFTTSEYTRNYIRLLEEREIDPVQLIEELPNGTVLLCYEAPGDFCHRRVLVEWIEEHTGFIVPEWKNEKELKKDDYNKVVDNLVDF